ncbi:MAG: thiamine pyrophosphate-binding protein [Peptococcia bacterium]
MEQNITVSEALIKFFKQNGIDTVFGVVGDTILPFVDALGKQTEVKFYATSHESGAAFMASYYAKLTGKIGVCIATSGPGCANLVNGLADAYFDKAPVLAITGQVQRKKIGTNAKQYINQQTLIQSVSKSSELVTDAANILSVVAKALIMAVSEHTVTHVSVPVDLFTQKVPNANFPEVAIKDSARWGSKYADALEESVMLLQSSQKPLLVIGKGQQAWREVLTNLAEKLGAGIILAQQAKGVMPDRHPLVISGIGEAYLPAFLNEVDCILLVGNASFETKFWPASAKVIQLVDNPENLDYLLLTKGIVGDVRQIMKVLSERLNSNRNQNWQDKIVQEKQNLENIIRVQVQNKTTPIHPAYLMTTLNKVIPEDAVIVCDDGGFIHWFDTYFQAQEHTVLVSSHWRSMGGGLPAALSACIAQKERKVIALVGDGGLLMSVGEIATAIKYQLPVVVVVANNHHYNLEKGKMESQGLIPFGCDLVVPDFAALAKAFGGEGKMVKKPEQLEIVLKESLTSSKPYIVDVQIDNVSLPFLQGGI